MAGMVNIRKYLERSAPEHLNDLKAIDSVLTAYDNKMAYGDGDDLGVPGDNALGLEETIKKADAIIAESKISAHDEVTAAARPGMIRVAIANKMNKKHLNTGGLTKEEKEKVEEKYDKMSKEDKDAHVKYFISRVQPKLKPQTKKRNPQNEGLLKEALNKPLNKFGQDLEKRLNALGFETKIFPGKSAVPQEASDAIIVKGSKKAGISYIKTSAGHEHIQVMVNADEINKLKKVKSYFKTGDAQYSPDKEIGWVIKNVKLTNPGDIMASDIQRYGKRAILQYYTSQEDGEKVKTRDVM